MAKTATHNYVNLDSSDVAVFDDDGGAEGFFFVFEAMVFQMMIIKMMISTQIL